MLQEGMELFTPFVNKFTTLRAHMEISHEDMMKFDALPKGEKGLMSVITVFDTVSQAAYLISRAPCGLGCECAAVIVECDECKKANENNG